MLPLTSIKYFLMVSGLLAHWQGPPHTLCSETNVYSFLEEGYTRDVWVQTHCKFVAWRLAG
jgi:hypothetical protein